MSGSWPASHLVLARAVEQGDGSLGFEKKENPPRSTVYGVLYALSITRYLFDR